MTGSVGSTSPRPRHGEREDGHANATSGTRESRRLEQRPRLRPRLLTSASRIEVPDDAAADPEVNDRRAIANVRMVRARSKSRCRRPPERTHARRADGLELGDEIDGRDLRSPGHRPAGKRRLEDLGEPDAVAQRACDRRDHVLDAGKLSASPSARATSTVPASQMRTGRSARGRRS
jgi:hypothetical protein